jgi:hypothetical protein
MVTIRHEIDDAKKKGQYMRSIKGIMLLAKGDAFEQFLIEELNKVYISEEGKKQIKWQATGQI